MAYKAGADGKAISIRLGHASEQVTRETYTHLRGKQKEEQDIIINKVRIEQKCKLLLHNIRIARQIQPGSFSLQDENYQELKMGCLILAITAKDRINGAAYLSEKEPPKNQRDWKAELKLGQYHNVLGLVRGSKDEIETEGNS